MDQFSKPGTLEVLLCALALFVSYKIWEHVQHPLYKFPGPSLAAWTNLPYSYSFMRGRLPFRILRLHEKYGSVVRIAPNELSFNSAASWKDIYGYRPGHKTFCKGKFYDGAAFVQSTGTRSIVNTPDPAEHGRMRRHLAHAFSDKSIREQEALITKEVDTLIEKLGEYQGAEEGTDLQRWLDMATFDIIGSLSFGKSFDALQNGGSHQTVAFILKALKLLSFLDTVQRFPWLDTVARILVPGVVKKLENDVQIHEEHTLHVIRERLENPSDRPDLLTRIIEKKDEADISDVQIAAHAADFLTAGSDSTGTCVCTALYYLFKQPGLMRNLQAEIRSSFDSYDAINALSTNSLPFLRAVIQESLRIYPPLPLGLPRMVPEGGDTIDGHFVPAGTQVSTNSFAACMDPRNFEDPWTFRPQRWLEDGGRDIREASQPFSVGTRTCIGQNLAWIEIRIVIAKLIYSYDLEWLNQDLDWHGDSQMHTLWHKPKLMVRVKPRKLQ